MPYWYKKNLNDFTEDFSKTKIAGSEHWRQFSYQNFLQLFWRIILLFLVFAAK